MTMAEDVMRTGRRQRGQRTTRVLRVEAVLPLTITLCRVESSRESVVGRLLSLSVSLLNLTISAPVTESSE